ncbi:MAG: glycosyltransferase family 2 protein [Candidatus Bathyarchaeota archaeon]|nr:MAG: glycosyltransferase family 2 protein [Candidatus Bathyarchaeota archaeon]
MDKSGEAAKKQKVLKLTYLLFASPLVLAYIIWRWFPTFAGYIVVHGFGYIPSVQVAHWLWHGTLLAFFTLYVIFAIGLEGVLVVAAWIWRRRRKPSRLTDFPTVSFVVPAYDEEKLISRCITSLFKTAVDYLGSCEIIVVDDGSNDNTYEAAWEAMRENQSLWPSVHGKVVRHSTNLGKVEAIRTAVSKASGELVATVDSDTWWDPVALTKLIRHMNEEGKGAISGYIHPTDGENEHHLYTILQQLEYSLGLGIFRNAHALGNAVPVVPGPMGLYRAHILRDVLDEKAVKSVTEDLEITLELQKRGVSVGYADRARSATVAPTSFKAFWNQRLRWFTGWIHNLVAVHKDLLLQRSWLSLVLWCSLVLAYCCGIIELAALLSLPLFLWFAPDRVFFLINVLIYILFAMFVGTIYQGIALKFSYGEYNHRYLLPYAPLFYVLNFVNICARVRCLITYIQGDRGCWHRQFLNVHTRKEGELEKGRKEGVKI